MVPEEKKYCLRRIMLLVFLCQNSNGHNHRSYYFHSRENHRFEIFYKMSRVLRYTNRLMYTKTKTCYLIFLHFNLLYYNPIFLRCRWQRQIPTDGQILLKILQYLQKLCCYTCFQRLPLQQLLLYALIQWIYCSEWDFMNG